VDKALMAHKLEKEAKVNSRPVRKLIIEKYAAESP